MFFGESLKLPQTLTASFQRKLVSSAKPANKTYEYRAFLNKTYVPESVPKHTQHTLIFLRA